MSENVAPAEAQLRDPHPELFELRVDLRRPAQDASLLGLQRERAGAGVRQRRLGQSGRIGIGEQGVQAVYEAGGSVWHVPSSSNYRSSSDESNRPNGPSFERVQIGRA